MYIYIYIYIHMYEMFTYVALPWAYEFMRDIEKLFRSEFDYVEEFRSMYVCVYIYIYICIYVFICVYIYTCK